MPYRRLPNTDAARLKALRTAAAKGRELPPFKLAFSQSTFARVDLFINSYERAIATYRAAYNLQVERSKDYQALQRKAKLYISHFIQVVNMAIARGELAESVRSIYGMELDERRVPTLYSERDIVEWGQRLIDGEAERSRRGFAPITNPTIAVVKVRYEAFMSAYHQQRIHQQSTHRTQSELESLRLKADQIILDVWNEVEETFKSLPEDERRERAKEYGVVYIYRRNELKGLRLLGNAVIPFLN